MKSILCFVLGGMAMSLSLVGAQIQSQSLPEPSPSNTLLPCESTQDFQLLFSGTLASFQSHYANYKQSNDTNTDVDPKWQYCAADSSICTNHTSTYNLRSRIKYANFDLRLDYMNDSDAGISYRGLTRTALWFGTAIEYSVDDRITNFPAQNLAGGIYGKFPPNPFTYHPYSTKLWNSVRIVAKGDSVQHWMNDTLVLAYRLWSPSWSSVVGTDAQFSQKTPGCKCPIDTGFIGFQGDHITTWHLRNLRIDTVAATVKLGPASCSQTDIRGSGSPPSIGYALELLPGALRVDLRHAGAANAEILAMDGRAAVQAYVEENGTAVRIQDWKNPGLYFLRVSKADGTTMLMVKIFLP